MKISRLNELVEYNPLTGEIFNRKAKRKLYPDEFGMVTIYDGAIKSRTKYKLDRLCWQLGNNKELKPKQKVLHKNLVQSDNRLTNLKLVPAGVYNKIQEAAKNLNGALRVIQHPSDMYNYLVVYFLDKIEKRELKPDIISAQQRLIQLQLVNAKVLSKYCCFED